MSADSASMLCFLQSQQQILIKLNARKHCQRGDRLRLTALKRGNSMLSF